MLDFEAVIHIDAPPERVWSVLTNIGIEPRWMKATRTVRFVAKERYESGAWMERVGRFLGMKLLWRSEVTAVEADRLIAFRHEGAVTGISRWEIAPEGAGSRVRFWSQGPAPGPLKWFPVLAAAAGRAGLAGDLARLKQIVGLG